MALEVVRLTKKLGRDTTAVTSLMVENMLIGFKAPKMQFNIVHPSNDNSGRYVSTKAYLDVPEIYSLVHYLLFKNPQIPNEEFKSYKGGPEKKLNNQIVSRIFTVSRKNENMVILQIESKEGEQAFATNKNGERVPGVVKPKRGGQSFEKGSIALSKDETRYLANSLDKELTAWRTAMNMDYMRNPKKYMTFNNDSGSNSSGNYYANNQSSVPNSNMNNQTQNQVNTGNSGWEPPLPPPPMF